MEAAEVSGRIRALRARLNEASGAWGGVEICAVTKTVSAADINLAYAEGIRVVGENKVQEALQKQPLLNPGFSLHIIGRVQLNKVKYIVRVADMVQSLDRVELAEALSMRSLAAGRVMDTLIQVNIAQEAGKAGVSEAELPAFLRACTSLDGIRVKGLMAIMPYTDDPETVRPYFRRMRAWFDRLKADAPEGANMDILSMGMSGDCMVAAEEGATMVRLGTAIFGKRVYGAI